MSAGSESVFPRIAPDHPLAEAARITNAMAEERGIEATLEWLGVGSIGELAYLAEQRALRAVAAAGPGVNMGSLAGGMDEAVARLIVQTPLWRDMRMLLVGCYLDGFAIGWKGRELSTDEPAGETAVRESIRRIVAYCWSDEEHDYRRSVEAGDIEEGSPRHIFADLRVVAKWLAEEASNDGDG